MIKTFTFTYGSLHITFSEIAELLGFEEETVPEPFFEIIESVLDEAHLFCNIKGGFRVSDSIEVDKIKGIIRIENQIFTTGKIVASRLKDSREIAVIVGTAGNKILEKARELESKGDPLQDYVFDTVGSVVAARAMEKVCDEIRAYAIDKNFTISDHFSPGYCDWSVADQQKLFALVPQNFYGVTLSETSLMNPVKSVSGIVGIGLGLTELGYQCSWCTDINCHYGKINRKKMMKKNG